jgi:hypothetical protein
LDSTDGSTPQRRANSFWPMLSARRAAWTSAARSASLAASVEFIVERDSLTSLRGPSSINLTSLRVGGGLPSKGLSDKDLVERAVELAGSAAALARSLGGIKPNTPNEWLTRVRQGGRISHDKRERLQHFVETIERQRALAEAEKAAPSPPSFPGWEGDDDAPQFMLTEPPPYAPAAVTSLLDLLRVDQALDPFAGLPPGYRERYNDFAREIEQQLAAYAEGLQRALEARRKALLDEARQPKKR